jgi:hypothetical protein
MLIKNQALAIGSDFPTRANPNGCSTEPHREHRLATGRIHDARPPMTTSQQDSGFGLDGDYRGIAHPRHPTRQIHLQPARDTRGEGGDDDAVEGPAF